LLTAAPATTGQRVVSLNCRIACDGALQVPPEAGYLRSRGASSRFTRRLNRLSSETANVEQFGEIGFAVSTLDSSNTPNAGHSAISLL